MEKKHTPIPREMVYGWLTKFENDLSPHTGDRCGNTPKFQIYDGTMWTKPAWLPKSIRFYGAQLGHYGCETVTIVDELRNPGTIDEEFYAFFNVWSEQVGDYVIQTIVYRRDPSLETPIDEKYVRTILSAKGALPDAISQTFTAGPIFRSFNKVAQDIQNWVFHAVLPSN